MNFSTQTLNDLANTVKEAYLVNGVPPSEAVADVAETHDLNIEQTKRLCEASNIAIKRALKQGKVDDVSFPVASPEEVFEMLQPVETVESIKEGSVYADGPFGEFCRYYLTRGAGMEKNASPKTIDQDTHVVVAEHARNNLLKLGREITNEKAVAEKIASRIVNYLADEMRDRDNINRSYSAVRQCVDTELVDSMYKHAYSLIQESIPMLYPEPRLEKLATPVNEESTIVSLFRKYAEQMKKVEEMQKKAERFRKIKIYHERRFREMITEEP